MMRLETGMFCVILFGVTFLKFAVLADRAKSRPHLRKEPDSIRRIFEEIREHSRRQQQIRNRPNIDPNLPHA